MDAFEPLLPSFRGCARPCVYLLHLLWWGWDVAQSHGCFLWWDKHLSHGSSRLRLNVSGSALIIRSTQCARCKLPLLQSHICMRGEGGGRARSIILLYSETPAALGRPMHTEHSQLSEGGTRGSKEYFEDSGSILRYSRFSWYIYIVYIITTLCYISVRSQLERFPLRVQVQLDAQKIGP